LTDDIEVEDLLYDYQEDPVDKKDIQDNKENKDNIQEDNLINMENNDINENETP